jgi:hypothetical protein
MERRRPAVFLMRDGREGRGFSTALIQIASMIYVVCHPVGSLETLTRVAFSAGREHSPVILSGVKRMRNEVEESRCSLKPMPLGPSTSLRFARDDVHRRLRLQFVDQRTRFACHVE